MANITASDVNKLRQITGAGMMDCKQALTESNGDFDIAIDNLRKKGQKVANKRADREASEGLVIAKVAPEGNFGIVVMLNCETDFVSQNKDFAELANNVADIALNQKPASLDDLMKLPIQGRSIGDHVSDIMGKIGEKIELREYQFLNAPRVYAYNHTGNKLASLASFNLDTPANIDQVGKEIVMQIAAMSPLGIDKDDIDPSVVEREIEIGKEQARQEGKPEEMLEKIAVGKLNKFYKESTLLNQDFVRDTKKTIRQVLEECDKNLRVLAFKRISVR